MLWMHFTISIVKFEYAWSSHLCIPIDQPNGELPSFYLGAWRLLYWINNNNSSSQQKSTTGYRQTSKSLSHMSPSTRVNTKQWEIKYDNSSMLRFSQAYRHCKLCLFSISNALPAMFTYCKVKYYSFVA